jgi:hypothetical protein
MATTNNNISRKIKHRYKMAWWSVIALLVGVYVISFIVEIPERRRAAAFSEQFAEQILGGTMGQVIEIVGRPVETDKRHTTILYYYDREFQRKPSKKKVRLMVVFLDGHADRVKHTILN